MSFLIKLVIWAIVQVLTYFLVGSHLKEAESAADQTSNEVKLPRIKLGLPVPSGFGRFQVSCVLIHFDKSCYVEHEHEEGGGKKGPKYVYYTYSMWCRAAVSLGPIDSWEELISESHRVKKDDDLTPKSGCDQGDRGNILEYEVFMGTDTQTDTNEPPSPAGLSYRGIAYARLHICLGVSPSPLVPKVTATRYVNTPVSGVAKIGDDANLVHVLYHILTDDNHIGLDPDLIDISTFDTTSQKLIQEGIGGSYVMIASSDLSKCVDEILDWIGCKLYRNEEGKICLKPIRPETPGVTLTDSDIIEITSVTIPTWFTVPCAMCLEWINPTRDYEPDWIYTFDPGVEDDVGMFKMQEFSYSVIASAEIAKKVLQQKATYLMYPKATIKFRTLKYLSPYSVFRIQSDRFGLEGAYRVTELVRELGEYSITAVEEPEMEPASIVSHSDVTGSIDIDFTSASIGWSVIEVTASIWGGCIKDENNPHLSHLDVTISVGGSRSVTGIFKHCCLGTTAHDITITGKDANYEILVNPGYTTYALEPPASDELWETGGLLVYIDDEIFSVRDAYVDEDGYHLKGVIRGFYDTLESEHSAGAQVWLIRTKSNLHLSAALMGCTLTVRAVPVHVFFGSAHVDIENASTKSLNYLGWEHCPYAVRNIQVNNQGDNFVVPPNTTCDFTWDLPKEGPNRTHIIAEIDDAGLTTRRHELLSPGAVCYRYTVSDQTDDGVNESTFHFRVFTCNSKGSSLVKIKTVTRS